MAVLFCFSFILGIALGSWLWVVDLWIMGSLIFAALLLLAGIFIKKLQVILPGVFLLGACVGLFFINVANVRLRDVQRKDYALPNIQITVRVESEKRTYSKYISYITKPLRSNEKILLLTAKGNDYLYGEELRLQGRLESPHNSSGFGYKAYLAKDKIYWIMPFPSISRISGSEYSLKDKFYRRIYFLRAKIRQSLIKSFPQKEASFLRAILLGDKGVIREEMRNDFARSGTSHIVALSGLHLSIIAVFIFEFLLLIGLWRKQATLLVIIFLVAFVLFMGARASLVRAALMAVFALLALSSGSVFQSEIILIYAAFLMLAFNPLLLRYDISFQLSFLAVAGIFSLYPPIGYFLSKLKLPKKIGDILGATLAAQIFTLPLVAYNFHTISFVAPLANFIVLLMLPLVLGAGFLFVLLFLMVHNAALLLTLFYPMVHFIVSFINWISRFPWAAYQNSYPAFPAIFIFSYYGLLGLAVFVWKRFYRNNLTPLAQWHKWSGTPINY